MKRLSFNVLMVVAILFASTANADLVMTFGNAGDTLTTIDTPVGPFQPDDEIIIPVYAHFTGFVQNPLTSYSFAIDLGGDGDTLSFFDPIDSGDIQNFSGGTYTVTPFAGGSFDHIIGWNGNVNISSDVNSPTHLFNFVFGSSPATPNGDYDFNYVPTGITGFFSNATPLTDLEFDNGQFRIAAIPEPTVFTLASAAVCLLSFRRRRSC